MVVKQIGSDIYKFKGLRIDIIVRVRLEKANRIFSIDREFWKCDQTNNYEWLTSDLDNSLSLDIGDDTNTKYLLFRVKTIYMA